MSFSWQGKHGRDALSLSFFQPGPLRDDVIR